MGYVRMEEPRNVAVYPAKDQPHTLPSRQGAQPGTPGAVKVSEPSRHWYAYRRDGKKQIKIRLFTDKAASLSKMAKMNTALERGDAGMIDPPQEHLERGALEHLEEFLPVMRSNGKSEKEKDRKETILRAFVAKLRSLSDLSTKAVDAYLAGIEGSVGNKKKHLSAISIWVTWLLPVRSRRVLPGEYPGHAQAARRPSVATNRRSLEL